MVSLEVLSANFYLDFLCTEELGENTTMMAHFNEKGQLVNEDGQIISEDGQTLIVDDTVCCSLFYLALKLN